MTGSRTGELSRRRLLAAGAGALASAWLPSFRIEAASAQSGCAVPPRFPAKVALYRQAFENWARTIVVDDVWTCAPRSPAEVAELANWAHREGYRLRPRGAMHGWSPFTVNATHCEGRIVLLDTTAHLTGLSMVSEDRVRAGAGVSIERLLGFLELRGLGLTSVPATGEVTIAGAIAIGAHGAALPADGEAPARGKSFGSMSNLVAELEAIVWDRKRRRYAVRRLERRDPACAAAACGLGRTMITEVILRVGPLDRLRCVSYTDIPAAELFAAPGSGGAGFASFVAESGRAEAIWFPFTESPWLKVWSVAPDKPAGSRQVGAPYNYPFSDNVPLAAAELANELISGNVALTPQFGRTEAAVVEAGLAATGSRDIWGPAKNTQLYIKATTLRVDELGWVVLTQRADLQRVLHEITSFYLERVAAYEARGSYPINGPVELRASGIDRVRDSGVAGASEAPLSPTVRVAGRPWDTAIWINVLTFPGTPDCFTFYREIERFILSSFRGDLALARPEWSKGWAFSANASHVAADVIGQRIPASFRRGRPLDARWDAAVGDLDRLDPHRVFSNAFLDGLLSSAR